MIDIPVCFKYPEAEPQSSGCLTWALAFVFALGFVSLFVVFMLL